MNKYSFKSLIGNISLFSDKGAIVKVLLNTGDFYEDKETELFLLAKKEILQYLDKLRDNFSFPFELNLSNFATKVLLTIKEIPYGRTISYSELAELSGYKNAVRAVGTVCKNNPLPLLIPCHRVIKKNGEIGEYNGGKDLKEYLLKLEKTVSL